MKKFAAVLAFMFWLLATAAFRAQSSAIAGDDPLAHLRPNHPRLLFTDQQLVAALTAAKTDPLREELNKRIIATAEFILAAPPIRHNDGKTAQEQERYAVYYILTEAMAYRLTGDERFF